MNIQYVIENDIAYILEVNPRASRTVPYLSKITGIPMIKVATSAMLGRSLKDQGYHSGLYPAQKNITVKAPVFSFAKLVQVDIDLAPEMKSTGEIMGVDGSFSKALYKAMVASGVDIPSKGTMIATIADHDKDESLPIIRSFADLGFSIYATGGTAKFLCDNGIDARKVNKIGEGSPSLLDLIHSGTIDLLINTLSKDKKIEREAAMIRRASVEHGIPCLTSLDTARALQYALSSRKEGETFGCLTIDKYVVREPIE
jgi:carbamoyl-phosphate synthase large subunit